MAKYTFPLIIDADKDTCRAYIKIELVNPHSGLKFKTNGIIDTGADKCAIPASLAKELGHDLCAGNERTITTVNGPTEVYEHTTSINVFEFDLIKLEYSDIIALSTCETVIDYAPKLKTVLLGYKGFLEHYVFEVDYINKIFFLSDESNVFAQAATCPNCGFSLD